MNQDKELTGQDVDRLLDQLVDDELNDGRRRELLCRLDDQPDGWKRCSMAFLQAQSWRRGMESFLSCDTVASDDNRSQVAKPDSKVEGGSDEQVGESSFSWLSLAASVMLAFVVGWYLKDLLPVKIHREPVRVTKTVNATDGTQTEKNLQEELLRTKDLAAQLVERLRLMERLSLTPERMQEIQRRGNRITIQPRGFIPYETEDGKQLVVPWGDVQVVPVKSY